MVIETKNHINEIYRILENVFDPEIPFLNVLDLGIVHSISLKEQTYMVEILPTYSGCPALEAINQDVYNAISKKGYKTKVKNVLIPAWNTDRISEKGRRILKKNGISPPLSSSVDKLALMGKSNIVTCTHCKSTDTSLISAFGSTACKALFKCNTCLEPFDYFKCLK